MIVLGDFCDRVFLVGKDSFGTRKITFFCNIFGRHMYPEEKHQAHAIMHVPRTQNTLADSLARSAFMHFVSSIVFKTVNFQKGNLNTFRLKLSAIRGVLTKHGHMASTWHILDTCYPIWFVQIVIFVTCT